MGVSGYTEVPLAQADFQYGQPLTPRNSGIASNTLYELRHPASVNPCGQVVATSQREYASEQTC